MIFDDFGQILLEVEGPTGWVDVTGHSASITVTRHDSQPGDLKAEVLDATLDPTQTDQVRMGKQARLRVRDAAGTGWVSLYAGALDDIEVTRNPHAAQGKTVTVKLSAVDAVSRLANTVEARGVAAIDHLRWLVTGVPFVINGQSTPLGAQTIVAGNDNASLWDQVLITRDSNLGYAWVDPENRLQVWDAALLGSTPAATIGPDRYSSLDTDFSLDSIINSVTILFRRYNIGTEASVDVPYGPYEDAVSIGEFGRRSASFTIQALVEDELAIEAYAADILARSATAIARARSARVPIRETSDLDLVRDVDLNTLVTVVLPDGVESQDLRVVGIGHTITSRGGWVLELTFAQPQSVAVALSTPGTGISEVPPGSITPTELDPVLADEITAHGEAVDAIEDDIAAANAEAGSGGSTIATAIAKRAADFNAGLATKSEHTLSPDPPGAAANNAGDVWEQHAAGDATSIIGRWRGMGGTAWSPMNLDATYIPLIDIGSGTFGDLHGTRLSAESVGVRELVVSDLNNYVENPGAETGTTDPHVAYSEAIWTTATFPKRSGLRGFQGVLPTRTGTAYVLAANGTRTDTARKMKVKPGDVIRAEAWVKYGAANTALATVFIDQQFSDGTVGNGGNVEAADAPRSVTLTGSYQLIAAEYTVPASTPQVTSVSLAIGAGNSTAGDVMHLDDMRLTRKLGGELIVDGSLLARHVTADLVEGLLVTGNVLQTDAAANRGIKISTSGIVGYDNATGIASTVIDPSTGRISAKGAFATATGFDDIEITPGNDTTPSAVTFWSDGEFFDDTSPASLSCFDQADVNGTNFTVSLLGVKSTNYAIRPSIEMLTVTAALYQRGDILYTAGGDGAGAGVSRHGFFVDGQERVRVDTTGLLIHNGESITVGDYIGQGTTGASINNAGRVVRTGSSLRYKEAVEPITLADAEQTLMLEPVTFLWRDSEVMGTGRQPGFIAEQAHDAGVGLWVTYDLAGRPDGFRYAELTTAHHALIRDLYSRIEALEGA